MTKPRDDWDDARLQAAFAARASRAASAPDGLVEAVLIGIATPAARPRSAVRPWLAAAAAVVVLVGFVAVRTLTQGDGRKLASSTPPAGSPSTAEPSVAGDLELPLVSVVDALAVRAAGDGRELAVGGFLSPMPTLSCPFIPAPENPTYLHCPQSFQWLMANPEILETIGPGSVSGGPPKGPAFHPSFALVDAPDVPIPASGAVGPVPVVLVGHFDDRRAALCIRDPPPETPCGDIFVVDRVASVNGEPRGVVTQVRTERFDDATQKQVTEQPTDLVEDVDTLALAEVPGGSVLSRQLVTLDQVTGVEPVLAKDEFVPHIGNPATLVWFVTVLDSDAAPPVARTFALIDGTNWFGEVTATGMRMLDRRPVSGPAGSEQPVVASGDPAAFETAPTSVLGIEVRDIASVMVARRSDSSDLGRDELAIKAWYVAPDPAARCDPQPAVHAPTPPCDTGRHWLLDRPEQFGHEPGQLRSNPDQWPPVLNPILPVDVPFDVPPTWSARTVSPDPVVVLGHFEDNRVDTYAGNRYFVIDALAWSRDRPVETIDSEVRLSSAATEDSSSVLARVAAVSPNAAVATWVTNIDAADFQGFAGHAADDATEFRSGASVWIVRRLVRGQTDGRDRLAVEWAYTADRGTRVWWTETPDSPADLATSIDVRSVDGRTDLVRVFDYDQQIESVAETGGRTSSTWRRVGPNPATELDVARGGSDREIAIRWTGGSCSKVWEVRIRTLADGQILVEPSAVGGECESTMVRRQILLRFDHPVDLDRIRTGDPCCG